jgi:hypothetical protein
MGLFSTGYPKGHIAEFFRHRDGSSGRAGPCKKIDPVSGAVIGVIERLEASAPAVTPKDTPAAPTPHAPAVALLAAGLEVAVMIGSPRSKRYSGKPSAIRKREQRKRKDNGQLRVELTLDEDLLDEFVAMKWFGDWDRSAPKVVARALLEGLREDILKRHA